MSYKKVNVNINGTVYNKERVREICRIRLSDDLSCRMCIFEGSVCEDIKARYDIENPSKYYRGMPTKEEKYNGNKQKQRKGS